MQAKTVEKAVKRTIVYSYAITQPFAFYSNAQAPIEQQMIMDAEKLSYGTHSEIVRHTQLKLNKLGYYTDKFDGIYGLYTERAVRQFQSSENLAVDGQMDGETLKRLLTAEKKQEIERIVPDLQVIEYGEISERVTHVQEVLYFYGYYTGKIDGIYGPLTEQAISQIIEERLVPSDPLLDVDVSIAEVEQNELDRNETIEKEENKQSKKEIMQLEVKRIDSNVIQTAKSLMGAPYIWGGTSPSGFDCSGFIQYIYKQLNYQIPRTVSEIWNFSSHVSNTAVGDLVFFETYQSGPSHVGIYLGDGNFIHCSTSRGVVISNLNEDYWKNKYIGAKRVDL